MATVHDDAAEQCSAVCTLTSPNKPLFYLSPVEGKRSLWCEADDAAITLETSQETQRKDRGSEKERGKKESAAPDSSQRHMASH